MLSGASWHNREPVEAKIAHQRKEERPIAAAALQFVRKVSGYRTPSKANEEVFEAAVDEVAEASWRLLKSLRPGARV